LGITRSTARLRRDTSRSGRSIQTGDRKRTCGRPHHTFSRLPS
jgi:hypothetical protein